MHTRTHRLDCACADDHLPYAPLTIYTTTGDVVKVVYIRFCILLRADPKMWTGG